MSFIETGLGLACALSACAVPLDDEPDAATPADEVVTLPSCAVLADEPEILGASGRVQTASQGGALLVAADALLTPSGTIDNAVYPATPSAPAAPDRCPEGLAPPTPLAPALDVSALGSDLSAHLGAIFAVGDTLHAFVRTSRGFTDLGTGLAIWDPATARFVATPYYLFAAGRPAYGEAALVDGDYVYAYGPAASGFLAEDCFVARAPLDALDDPTAWRYYRDGNDFGDDPDEAWPIFKGGGGLALTVRDRLVVVAYHDPIGDTILLRTGLGPTGPWSPATPVTRCALPTDAFCGALAFHPALSDASALVLTYAIASFADLAPRDRLTRLVRFALGP